MFLIIQFPSAVCYSRLIDPIAFLCTMFRTLNMFNRRAAWGDVPSVAHARCRRLFSCITFFWSPHPAMATRFHGSCSRSTLRSRTNRNQEENQYMQMLTIYNVVLLAGRISKIISSRLKMKLFRMSYNSV